MHHWLVAALSALLLAILAGCESTSAGVAGDSLLEGPRHCTHCGWIVSKREIQPVMANPHSPVVYEYGVRMADGTHSAFRAQLSVRWRVGERLILFPGEEAEH